MAIVTLREVSVGFHGPLLLDGVDCQIETGQKIGLLGRNGSGKTTLMRILRGDLPPDAGQIVRAPGTRVSLLPQDVPQNVGGTIAEVVAQGLTPDDDPHESAVARPSSKSKKFCRGWISTAARGSRFCRRA